MELLTLNHIKKTYGRKKKTIALQDFQLTLEQGEMIAVMGKSGSGKSTMLQLLAGIDVPDEGQYRFQGQDMRQMKGDRLTRFRRDHIGVIMQHFALIPNDTVFGNIELPLRLQKVPKKQRREMVEEIAKEVGISKHLEKYPNELSGGEAQRTAIARAVVHQPQLILADEPTGALDEANSQSIMEVFHRLHDKGNTCLIVTHDPKVAMECERIVYIRDGKNQAKPQ